MVKNFQIKQQGLDLNKRFGILLARQRSGTGALGTILDKHSQIKYLGEIFHPGNVGSAHNFFTYKLEAVKKDPELMLPERGLELLNGFLEWKAEVIKDQLPVIDVKYSSLHHLTSPWLEPAARPALLTHCINHRLPIIHLTRENYLHGFVSGRLAEANKVWHARSETEIKVTSVEIDTEVLLSSFRQTRASVELVRHWLGKRHFVYEVEYANLFTPDGNFSDDVRVELEDLLDIDAFTDTTPVFVKQNKAPLTESIKNYEQVFDALKDTEYVWMLET